MPAQASRPWGGEEGGSWAGGQGWEELPPPLSRGHCLLPDLPTPALWAHRGRPPMPWVGANEPHPPNRRPLVWVEEAAGGPGRGLQVGKDRSLRLGRQLPCGLTVPNCPLPPITASTPTPARPSTSWGGFRTNFLGPVATILTPPRAGGPGQAGGLYPHPRDPNDPGLSPEASGVLTG